MQARYVLYVELLLRQSGGVLPPPPKRTLSTIRVLGLLGCADLRFEILQENVKIYDYLQHHDLGEAVGWAGCLVELLADECFAL
jgi:hypothetical protein